MSFSTAEIMVLLASHHWTQPNPGFTKGLPGSNWCFSFVFWQKMAHHFFLQKVKQTTSNHVASNIIQPKMACSTFFHTSFAPAISLHSWNPLLSPRYRNRKVRLDFIDMPGYGHSARAKVFGPEALEFVRNRCLGFPGVQASGWKKSGVKTSWGW